MTVQLIGRPELLRDLNYHAVVELLATQGPKSRAEIAGSLNLSRPSVSRLVEGLLKVGVVEEGARVASKVGRRQTLLDINPEAAVVAGVSVRSHWIRLLLTDLKGQRRSQRQETTKRDSPRSLVQQIARLLTDVRTSSKTRTPLAAVSVGISGVWDDEDLRVHSVPNLPFLEGVDLLALLKAELGDTVLLGAVQLDNDVNYTAIGEFAYGAAQGYKNIFYLNFGSGIGGGAVVEGRLHRGFQGFVGEVGYLPVYHDGRYQPLEHLISHQALEHRAKALGVGDEAFHLLEHARSGHEGALDVVDEVCDHLAVVLCSVITTLNPEMIVIGGSMGRYSDLLIPRLECRLQAFLPVIPTMVRTGLGRDAALRGAVALALELARDCLIRKKLS